MKMKLPHSVYNWLSLTGAVIASISFFMIVFLFVVATFFDRGGSYLGLIIYIVLPAFFIAGLLLIPLGMYKRIRKEKKSGMTSPDEWPKFDLNDRRHRNAFTIFTVGTVIFLFISAIGSYEAFHYTESVEFCGEICHDVMAPEYIAYQNSSHAKVSCVACHVGSGADWYVRSKMSGLYQVYAVMADVYPRPIPTPISNLRPASETCQECHWPEKFYSYKLRHEKHFLPDEENTEWDIYMTMKIGASHSGKGLLEGSHWHINPDVKIEYAATDNQRQNIPWVKYTNLQTGEVKIFEDQYEPLEEGVIDTLEIRTMDCMDCHNRPSHSYQPPAFFVNKAMAAGNIPKNLPEIKTLTMELAGEEYETMDEAMTAISDGIYQFYDENYPDTDKVLVDKAVAGFQNKFSKNIFPEMKVRWDAYPNNIGHVEFDGCFRCHNDIHMNEAEEVISKDCNICHAINAQGPADDLTEVGINEELEFKHPTDIEEAWKEMLCVDCHTGLNP